MDGWKKVVAGALLGVAGTIYATDEEARRNLPRAARDFPDNVRQRFNDAVAAGRLASSRRRQEILRDLASHGGGETSHRPRRDGVEPETPAEPLTEEPLAEEPTEERVSGTRARPVDDATEPIDPKEALSREEREGV